MIPPAATSVKVTRMYKCGSTPPLGFLANQLPLVRVSYTETDMHGNKTSHRRVICGYEDVKKKFPRVLLDCYLSNLKLIPYEKTRFEAIK